MARIQTIAFGKNSLTAGIEITNSFSANATIQTSIVQTAGQRALKCDNTLHNDRISPFYHFANSGQSGPIFVRSYIYIATLPAVTVGILGLNFNADDTTSSYQAIIKLTATGTLQLYYSNAGVLTQVGSDSPALSTGQWYAVEMWYDHSLAGGSQILKARINGAAEFAAATNLTIQNTVQTLVFGTNIQADVTDNASVIYHASIAINDSTGTSQASYPGLENVEYLLPNAAGEANTFATQTGGTAGAANNFGRVNEVTPDDATTFNGSNTLNQVDLFDITNSGMGVSDTVNVVQMHARFRNNVADATTAIKFEIEKANAGTKAQSNAIVPNTTTWSTNATADPRSPVLTLYKDPDATAWTQTTINSMRIGYILTTGGTNRIDVTNVGVYVCYTPAVATTRKSYLPLLGVG